MKAQELKQLIKEEIEKVLTEGKTVTIGPGKNLKLKLTSKGLEITREDYNGGMVAEEFTIFKNELADFIKFIKEIK